MIPLRSPDASEAIQANPTSALIDRTEMPSAMPFTEQSFPESVSTQQVLKHNIRARNNTSSTEGNIALKTYVEQQAQSDVSEHKSRWLRGILGGWTELLPAELSGASQDPKKHLLGIPKEIRDNIFRRITLLHDQPLSIRIWKQVTFTKPSHVTAHSFIMEETCKYGCVMSQHVLFSEVSNHLSDSAHLFLTCKQIFEEGRRMFYGDNEFRLDGWPRFLGYKCPLIGDFSGTTPSSRLATATSALIKDLDCDLRILAGMKGTSLLDSFVVLVCQLLMGLQKLCLRLNLRHISLDGFYRYDEPSAYPSDRAILLYTAARITHQHPSLRKAIWDARTEDWEGNSGREFAHAFRVQIFPERKDKEIFQHETVRLEDPEKEFGSKPIVLDSREIRETPWDELRERPVTAFALPETVTSSEAFEADA
ncbi:hypothetical protein H2200_007220 [Cladophialophora chaetospira]|uniref:Uncharacterized protein n=1 Tax=Cladophialophora chaetospira TaxID=386627 RepID=A0AA39CHB7_9EURO|nr:hypothetical protein H2200_007220 [Cladophialophora chaetospira]